MIIIVITISVILLAVFQIDNKIEKLPENSKFKKWWKNNISDYER